MIFFKPTPIDETHVKFEALEGEEKKGECLLDLSGKNADIYSLAYDSDKPYLVDGLLRAGYNYAANKGFYMGSCSCKNFDEVLRKMNFNFENGIYSADIPSILMGGCCKKH